MGNDLNRSEDSVHPPRWAQNLLHAVLKPEVAEAESGDLLEAYRDSLYPSQGRWRANLWYLFQVSVYVVRSNPAHWSAGLTSALWVLVLELIIGVPLVALGGGLTLLATLIGSVFIFVLVPILWLSGDERRAAQAAAAWVVYLALYVVVSTAFAFFHERNVKPIAIGQEFCADAGCFGVDKVVRGAAADSEVVYTLSWHLASRDTKAARRFPGKGLELFVFDDQGREFPLPAAANQDPLNVLLPPGETVRQSIAFRVPEDAKELFLGGRYRPFTFQSLLPGSLSLLPHANATRIRIR